MNEIAEKLVGLAAAISHGAETRRLAVGLARDLARMLNILDFPLPEDVNVITAGTPTGRVDTIVIHQRRGEA